MNLPLSWSGWPDLNRRPLRPELAAAQGVWLPSQLAQGVGDSSCSWLLGVVAVLLLLYRAVACLAGLSNGVRETSWPILRFQV